MRTLFAKIMPVALVFCAAQASAAPAIPGWYVGLSGGSSFLDDAKVSNANTTASYSYKTGGAAALELGYALPNNLRIEAEAGYHANKRDSVTYAGNDVEPGIGWQEGFSYMGNVYYDIYNSTAWTPYVGVGAGGDYLVQTAGQDKTNVFAYQGMAGISYTPALMPRTQWSLGYRYFTDSNANYNGYKIKSEASNNAEIGFRYHF